MEEDEDIRMDFDSIDPINSEQEGNSNNNDDGEEINEEHSDISISNSDESNKNIVIKYNENDFKKDKIIEYLMKNKILKDKILCLTCNNEMKLSNNKQSIDGVIWQCSKKGGYFKYDNKVNIKAGNILEDIKIDIRIAYFLIFYNFIERYSINKAFINCKEFY